MAASGGHWSKAGNFMPASEIRTVDAALARIPLEGAQITLRTKERLGTFRRTPSGELQRWNFEQWETMTGSARAYTLRTIAKYWEGK